MVKKGSAVAVMPADARAGVAYVQIYGPRCGLHGSLLLSLGEAQKLIGELQAAVDSEVVRRLSACADALLSA